MSFNSSVQQLFVGFASILAGLIVVKMPDNTLAHYEVTGYVSIAMIFAAIVVATLLHKQVNKDTARQLALATQ